VYAIRVACRGNCRGAYRGTDRQVKRWKADLPESIQLEHGATLMASLDRGHYPAEGRSRLIAADNREDIAITGTGTIHGQGEKAMAEELPYIFRAGKWRPWVAILSGCRNVLIRDVTVRDGAVWTLWRRGWWTEFAQGSATQARDDAAPERARK
jgi:polygalacturonase